MTLLTQGLQSSDATLLDVSRKKEALLSLLCVVRVNQEFVVSSTGVSSIGGADGAALVRLLRFLLDR